MFFIDFFARTKTWGQDASTTTTPDDVIEQANRAIAEKLQVIKGCQAEISQHNSAVTTLTDQKTSLMKNLNALAGELAAMESARDEVDGEILAKRSQLAELNQRISHLTDVISRIESTIHQHKNALNSAELALRQRQQIAMDKHKQTLENLARAESERIEAINKGLKVRAQKVAELKGQYNEIRDRRIAETEREIRLRQQEFNLRIQQHTLEFRESQTRALEDLKFQRYAIISEIRPQIEAPLLNEIAALEVELGKLQRKLAGKDNGNSLVWTAEQIRAFLLDDDPLAPSHLRICGATKSGKSYFVNQIISGGLKSLGFDAEFTVVDPYFSQTQWAVKPTISDDSEAARGLILQWSEACDGEPLPKPSILVVDELDSLLADYPILSEAIKKIVKKGRHFNRFFYWLGQNGNCPKQLQWSDVKNFNQIYLGSVADDYAENGLKGRNKNRWLGELEALREKSKYHAIAHPKGMNPYTVLLPGQYFEPAPQAIAPQALTCPKCGSRDIKKNGIHIDGRQKIKCSSCLRTSILQA